MLHFMLHLKNTVFHFLWRKVVPAYLRETVRQQTHDELVRFGNRVGKTKKDKPSQRRLALKKSIMAEAYRGRTYQRHLCRPLVLKTRRHTGDETPPRIFGIYAKAGAAASAQRRGSSSLAGRRLPGKRGKAVSTHCQSGKQILQYIAMP